MSGMKSDQIQKNQAAMDTPSNGSVLTFLNREEQKRLSETQMMLLEMIALGKPLKDILTRLALFMEDCCEGVYCSILLVDDNGSQLRLGAVPSLPSSFTDAIDGLQIGPDQGSCGSAAHYKMPVISVDIQNDPLWTDYRDWIVNNFGIHTAWSYPMFCSNHILVGTFDLYSQSKRPPNAKEMELVQMCTHIASIAIERHCDAMAVTRAKEKAEEASLAKSLFLANMGHEFRTPLNAILGYTQMLREELADHIEQEALSDIDRIELSGQHLLNMITFVMDMCHLETGKIESNKQMFDATQLVNEIVSSNRQSILRGNNQLNWPQKNKPTLLRNDPHMFEQILKHLVTNAGKFCQDGVIGITVQNQQIKGADHTVVTVSDTGIGVEPDMQQRIFEAFTQANVSPTREYNGIGIGLAICAGYAKLMGGWIEVQSKPGQGSAFSLYLPALGKG